MKKLFLTLGILATAAAYAQETRFSEEILKNPSIQKAFTYIDSNLPVQVEEWIKITEISSPSKQETNRAAYIESEMKKAGLDSVYRDDFNNVIGTLKGNGSGPTVAFAAHTDTVFPMYTAIKVRREGDTLYAPGVGDNSASCANMLQAIRAIRASNLRFKGDLIFIGTVQEEIGFRGMRHYLEKNRDKVNLLVALDGSLDDVYYGALGIYWYKFIYSGPGAHTLHSRGKPNPNKAVARAILDISAIPLPPENSPSVAYCNIGMIGGGKIYNAISQESFFTVDLRTTDPVVLKDLDQEIRSAAENAAKQEGVEFRVEMANETVAGGTEEQLAERRKHPIVQTGVDTMNYLLKQKYPNMKAKAVASGSTDGNVGVELGIPTIAVGRTIGKGQHTLDESAEIGAIEIGTKQIILLAAFLSGLQ
jgi:tripeptide aminopeptidase